MKGEEYNDNNFVQCQSCGNIYMVATDKEIPIETFTIEAWCPKCGRNRGLNCGNNIDDLYDLININVDKRYYRY